MQPPLTHKNTLSEIVSKRKTHNCACCLQRSSAPASQGPQQWNGDSEHVETDNTGVQQWSWSPATADGRLSDAKDHAEASVSDSLKCKQTRGPGFESDPRSFPDPTPHLFSPAHFLSNLHCPIWLKAKKVKNIYTDGVTKKKIWFAYFSIICVKQEIRHCTVNMPHPHNPTHFLSLSHTHTHPRHTFSLTYRHTHPPTQTYISTVN